MVGLLGYMIMLSFEDAANTGEPVELVAPVVAWLAIVAVSGVFILIRKLVSVGMDSFFEALSDLFDR